MSWCPWGTDVTTGTTEATVITAGTGITVVIAITVATAIVDTDTKTEASNEPLGVEGAT